MGDKLIEGTKEEWALVRRHTSEKTFGVQLCGGKPGHMVPSAEVVRKWLHESEGGKLDFIDINLVGVGIKSINALGEAESRLQGCPIDLVFQRGAGSAREPLSIVCITAWPDIFLVGAQYSTAPITSERFWLA